MFEYDQRQYGLMLDRLTAFERGAVSLDKLVADLEGLLNALEVAELSWKQTFRHYWGTLETGRAIASSEGTTAFTAEASRALRDAAAHLKLMVLEKIDDAVKRTQNSE
jgi:hypothetical protein